LSKSSDSSSAPELAQFANQTILLARFAGNGAVSALAARGLDILKL
jgi:hypothetical protein